jgi:hypothetical protein
MVGDIDIWDIGVEYKEYKIFWEFVVERQDSR